MTTKTEVKDKRKFAMYSDLNEYLNKFIKLKPKNKSDYENLVNIKKFISMMKLNSNQIGVDWDYYEKDCDTMYENDLHVLIRQHLNRLIQTVSDYMFLISDFIIKKNPHSILTQHMYSTISYCPVMDEFEVVNRSRYWDDFKSGQQSELTVIQNLEILSVSTCMEMVFYIITIIPTNCIRICPNCKSIFFYSSRSDIMYCGGLCAKAVAQRNYVARKKLKGMS